MGYFEELCKKKLESPEEGILVVAPIYLSKHVLTYTFEKCGGKFSKFKIKITDNEGNTVYKGRKTRRKRIIYTADDSEPIFTLKETNTRKARKKMYIGKNKKGRYLGLIRPKHSHDGSGDRKYSEFNYKIKFHNSVTKKNEFVEMNCDSEERVCCVFAGKEKDGAPVICKMIRDQNPDIFRLTVQIAENVDYMFMLGLTLFFFGKKNYTNTDEKTIGRKRIFIDGNRNSYVPDFCQNNTFYFNYLGDGKYIRCWKGPETFYLKKNSNDTGPILDGVFRNNETFPCYCDDVPNDENSFFAIYTGNNTYVRRYNENDGLVNKDSFHLYYDGKNIYSTYDDSPEVDLDDDSSSCTDGFVSTASYEHDDNIDNMCNLFNSIEINSDF